MATISKNRKEGKLISFKFRAYIGRDEKGKQLFRYTTWRVPKGMTETKARRVSVKEAEKWEVTVKESAAAGHSIECSNIHEQIYRCLESVE